jgi:hypothetical protein
MRLIVLILLHMSRNGLCVLDSVARFPSCTFHHVVSGFLLAVPTHVYQNLGHSPVPCYEKLSIYPLICTTSNDGAGVLDPGSL